ncbi:alpha/beta fold hydrolase [Methanoregula sp.]|uniref:esterase/lipase family protein n=1 Tax=Methanoregula sp. TaxID=2052170 RepID=UPI0026085159|nr:alpha/beta fold hydrolase [Methanoregula sp.]MDD5142042.1 alpha/beta fold hydrolase [Methanoregula sp.]
MENEKHSGRLPAVLVHGWNSHPGIWNRLLPLLKEASIPAWIFDHTGLADRNIPEIAAVIGDFVQGKRDETGYYGDVDVVCHSVGTCIARYYLEVIDGERKTARARQLIGLGPPNNGSAMAELFFDPVQGAEIINRLTGVFVPPGYNPSADRIVHDVRPGSAVMHNLKAAGIRQDMAYHIIVTGNPGESPDFFPLFHGATWERDGDGSCRPTFHGDGVVTHSESALPGITLEIITTGPGTDEAILPPGQFCHIHLPRNPVVMERVLGYLTLPADRT